MNDYIKSLLLHFTLILLAFATMESSAGVDAAFTFIGVSVVGYSIIVGVGILVYLAILPLLEKLKGKG